MIIFCFILGKNEFHPKWTGANHFFCTYENFSLTNINEVFQSSYEIKFRYNFIMLVKFINFHSHLSTLFICIDARRECAYRNAYCWNVLHELAAKQILCISYNVIFYSVIWNINSCIFMWSNSPPKNNLIGLQFHMNVLSLLLLQFAATRIWPNIAH